MLVSRLEGVIDRPLERVGGTRVVGPAPASQLLDDALARRRRTILSQLELGAAGRDAESDGGQLVERALVEGIVDGERTVPSLGLMLGEEALLLRHHHRGILRYLARALEDDVAVIRRGGAAVLRMHPVRGNHGQNLVHLEGAPGARLQVGDLLVRPHQVELDGGRRVHEVVEADVTCAVLAEGDQTPHLLGCDEAVDLVCRDLRVVVVEDHVRLDSSLAAFTRPGSARRWYVVRAMALAAATMPRRARGFTAASANSRV